jgi:hypothetical protein
MMNSRDSLVEALVYVEFRSTLRLVLTIMMNYSKSSDEVEEGFRDLVD